MSIARAAYDQPSRRAVDGRDGRFGFLSESLLPSVYASEAIREILDHHGCHLTVFGSFTFSEPEDLPAIATRRRTPRG